MIGSARVPAKLMLAGEYSVLFPGNMAVSIPVRPGFSIRSRPADRFRLSVVRPLPADRFGVPVVRRLPADRSGESSSAVSLEFRDFASLRSAPRDGPLGWLPRLVAECLLATGHEHERGAEIVLGDAWPMVDGRWPKPAAEGVRPGRQDAVACCPSATSQPGGSSAAMAVGLVRIALRSSIRQRVETSLAPTRRPSPRDVFRIAALAHFAAQGSGSGYDVAAVACGRPILFVGGDVRWSMACPERAERAEGSMACPERAERAEGSMDGGRWSELRKLPMVVEVHTGRKADTASLLARFEQARKRRGFDAALAEHVACSNALCIVLAAGERTLDGEDPFPPSGGGQRSSPLPLGGGGQRSSPLPLGGGGQGRGALAASIASVRSSLLRLDRIGRIGIHVPEVEAALAVADSLGIPAKVSGAGGGDSIVAFPPDMDAARLLADACRGAGLGVSLQRP